MNPVLQILIILLCAAGVIVGSITATCAAYERGKKRGKTDEFWRVRRLYIMRRAACEYELITGRPIETARRQLRPPMMQPGTVAPGTLIVLREGRRAIG